VLSVPSNFTLSKQVVTTVQQVVFYAIGDVPYSPDQSITLKKQIKLIPNDAEFLIHVGDIRSGHNPSLNCLRKEYSDVATLLRTSSVPVFIIRTYCR
jgi:hypothetical protein